MRWQERTVWALAVCAALAMWATAGAQSSGPSPATPIPPAGTDTFDSIAEVVIEPLKPSGIADPDADLHTADLVGPTIVQRGNPQNLPGGRYQIPTELLSLDLQGFNSNIGDVFIHLNPKLPSRGHIAGRRRMPFPAESFFDVFVEIDLPRLPQLGPLHNEQPVRLEAVINAIPPIEKAYVPPANAQPVPLLNQKGQPVGLLLRHVQHVPCEPSHRKIKRELILIEKKLDQLLQNP